MSVDGEVGEAVQISPHQIAFLHVAMYKMLHNITASVGNVMEGIQSCLQIFSWS